jgi:hypothetical protein
MSSQKTLFLGWRDPHAHRWYPVGRLDADDSPRKYTFGYTQGATEAAEQSGFVPLYDFPSFQRRLEKNKNRTRKRGGKKIKKNKKENKK